MRIALTSIPVDDPIKAYTFYTEILGFVERTYIPEAGLAIVASPEEPDGTGLLLEPNDNPISKAFQQGVYEAELPIIVLGVDNLQGEYQRLKRLGVVFKQEPTKTEYGTEATLDDTCGNLIQLYQA